MKSFLSIISIISRGRNEFMRDVLESNKNIWYLNTLKAQISLEERTQQSFLPSSTISLSLSRND